MRVEGPWRHRCIRMHLVLLCIETSCPHVFNLSFGVSVVLYFELCVCNHFRYRLVPFFVESDTEVLFDAHHVQFQRYGWEFMQNSVDGFVAILGFHFGARLIGNAMRLLLHVLKDPHSTK